MCNIFCLTIVIFSCGAATISGRNNVKCEGDICFKEGFVPEQDRDIPPATGNDVLPIVINIKFEITSVSSVDSDLNIVSLGLRLQQKWIDNRIFPKHKLQKGELLPIPMRWGRNPETGLSEKIWLPNIWIYSMIQMEVQRNFQEQSLIWISQEDGNNMINYDATIFLRIKCPMKYWRYPFDEHQCDVRISSADLNMAILKFNMTHPTEWDRDANTAAYFVITALPLNETELVDVWEGRNWSVAGFHLQLKRIYDWRYIINYYTSSGILI